MNNDLYEKNLFTIEKRWPEYLEGLKKPESKCGVSCEMTEEDGRLFPLAKKDGKTYQLSSYYSDDIILDKWAGFVNLNIFEVVIYLFGIGTGVLLRRLLEMLDAEEEKRTALLVYEPETVILGELIRYYDYSDILSDERVTLAIGSLEEDALRKWTRKHMDYKTLDSAGSAYYLNYPRLYARHREKYDADMVDLLRDYYANIGFRRCFSKILFPNTLANIERMADSLSITSLVDSYPEGMPAFIVSSGPSLSKNILELRKAKGKGLIIAMDSALGVFDKVGLLPDIYVSIDPEKQEENFVYEWLKEIPAVMGITSPPYVLYDGKQPCFMMSMYDEYTGRFLIEHSGGRPFQVIIQGGGSVATYGFSLAHALGAKTIIFVGQDLAYTGEKAHAAEVSIETDEMLDQVDTVDIYGNPIKSSRNLMSYKLWFEYAIKECEEGLTFVDATEGGVKINGTEVMTLGEAIDRYCNKEYDIKGMLSGCERLLNEEEKSEYFDLIRDVPDKMDEIIRDSKKILRNYEKIEALVRKGQMSGAKIKKLLSENTILSEKVESNPAYAYVDMTNLESETNVEERVNNMDPDKSKDMINMCALGREHTENIIKAAKRVKKDISGLKLEEN